MLDLSLITKNAGLNCARLALNRARLSVLRARRVRGHAHARSQPPRAHARCTDHTHARSKHARTLHKPRERAQFTARLKFFQRGGAPFCLAGALGLKIWYFEAIWPAVGLQLLQFDVPFVLLRPLKLKSCSFKEIRPAACSLMFPAALLALGQNISQFQAIWPAVGLQPAVWCFFCLIGAFRPDFFARCPFLAAQRAGGFPRLLSLGARSLPGNRHDTKTTVKLGQGSWC